MELLTRSVSLTPPTNPEITSIILTKFPYAKLTSKAFGGVTTRFLFTLLGRLGCPLLVILIAWVDSLIFALHLVGVNPTFRACIVPRKKKQRPFGTIVFGECHLLFGETNSPETTSAVQHSALYIFFLRLRSFPHRPATLDNMGNLEDGARKVPFSELWRNTYCSAMWVFP